VYDRSVVYEFPVLPNNVHFAETFDDESAIKRWVVPPKQIGKEGGFGNYEGEWGFELPIRKIFPNDKGLVMKSEAKAHSISARLFRTFELDTKPLILQYEVNFQNGMYCGGAYIKLLRESEELRLLNKLFKDIDTDDRIPYVIMFGPEKCWDDMKLHLGFRHKDPLTGSFSEKHVKIPANLLEEIYTDRKPHLYRLIVVSL